MGRRQFGTIRKLPSGRFQARYRDDAGNQIAALMTSTTATAIASTGSPSSQATFVAATSTSTTTLRT